MNKVFVSLALSAVAGASLATVLSPSGVDDTAAIQAAIDAAPAGGTVTLGDGLFILTDELLIEKGITVQSEHGRDFTQLKQTAGSTTNMFRVFHLNHKDAFVRGFAISNSGALVLNNNNDAYIPGAGVYIDAAGGFLDSCIISNCNALTKGCVNLASADAVISNCIIRANTVSPNPRSAPSYITTPSLQMSAGLATHCTIDGNNSYRGNYASCRGAGAYLDGGRLSYCFITNNVISSSKNEGSRGAGVYIPKSTTAVVDNCLIAGNSTEKEGGGVYASSGSFTNCTIVGNIAKTGAGGVHVAATTTFYGCIVQDNTNASGFTDIGGTAGVFTDCVTDGSVTFSSGYVPEYGTHAIDVCPATDYADNPQDALDLAGQPRLSGGGVDAGAFEFQYPDFIMAVDYLSDSVVAPGDTFSAAAIISSSDPSLVRYGWAVDNGAPVWSENSVFEASDLASGAHMVSLYVRYDNEEKGCAGTLPFLVTCPDVYVVSPESDLNHIPVYPYATPEGAATNLLDAIGCARSGTTVHVGPGVYGIPVPLELIGAVKLISDAGRDLTVIRQTATGGSENRCVHLNDAGALLDGFTLTGASGNHYGIAACIDTNGGVIRNCAATNNLTGSSGGSFAVLCASGIISNCVVRYNRARDRDATGPVGVYMNAGLVIDCNISCNTNSTGFTYGGNNGCGVLVAGGRLSRCRVCDNAVTRDTNNKAGGKGAGVCVAGAAAVVDNCLIARNYAYESRGGVAFTKAGTVLNCTIADNVVRTDDNYAGIFSDNNIAGKVVNTIIQGNASEGGFVKECDTSKKLVYDHSLCAQGLPEDRENVTEAASFRGVGDYRILAGSVACKAGTVEGWEQYLVGGKDLPGLPRIIVGCKVDLGCYQSSSPGTKFLLK